MFRIKRFACEQCVQHGVTDAKNPTFSFCTESDRNGAALKSATLRVNGWETQAQQAAQRYEGPALQPFTTYTAELTAVDDQGSTDAASLTFETEKTGTFLMVLSITDAPEAK